MLKQHLFNQQLPFPVALRNNTQIRHENFKADQLFRSPGRSVVSVAGYTVDWLDCFTLLLSQKKLCANHLNFWVMIRSVHEVFLLISLIHPAENDT